MSEVVAEKKSVNKEIAWVMLPIVVENLAQVALGAIITAMVGRLLADEIAAQGISNRIYNCGFALFKGMSIGATVLIAMHAGRGALGKCRRMAEQGYLVVIPLALMLVGLVLLFARPFLGFFTDNQDILDIAMAYTDITVWALPFMAIVHMNTAAFHGRGNTWLPLIIAFSMLLVNVILGRILITGVFGRPGLGITGAAIATLIVQIFGALMGLFILYFPGGFHKDAKHGESFFRFDFEEIKNILSMGFPASMESLFWQFAAIIISRIILSYGSEYYSAYLLGMQAEMMMEMPAIGFSTAATTLSGKAVGMKDGPLFRTYYKSLHKMASIAAIFATIPLFVIPGPLMRILTDKPDIIAIGAVYVFLMGFAQFPQCVSKVYSGFIRASGGKRVPMYISFLGIWLVRVPMVVIFGTMKADIRILWAAIALDQIIRFTVSAVYMKRKDVLHCVEREISNAKKC